VPSAPDFTPTRNRTAHANRAPPARRRVGAHLVYNKFSQSRRYFYTRRFTYELTGILREYHIRVSARDPFGNVGVTSGTLTNLP
jgi:hypothetical protein